MTGQLVLEMFEAAPEAVVPCCAICGARGEPIVVDGGMAVPHLHAASQWALLEIEEHKREMHSGRVFCGCGLLMGRVRNDSDFDALIEAVRPHTSACSSGGDLTREVSA